MRRTTLILFLWLLSSLLGGCYGAKVLRQPVTVEESARDLEAVRQQQVAVETRLGELEKRSSEQAELLRGMRAETTTRYGDLETRLATIDSRLRDVLGQREGFGRPGASFWSAAPGAPRTGETGGGVIPAPGLGTGDPGTGDPGSVRTPTGQSGDAIAPEPAEASVPGADGAGVAGADSPVSGGIISESDTKRLYDQAYKDLTRGNYSLALLGFREYLRRSPASDLADNAQYWTGECYYAQRDYDPAIQEFLRVQKDYPQGDKVPAALLKTGFSFLQLEDRASARRYLNQVVEQFPNSEEAVSARNKLRSAF
jgi:tol-pal system protein YbgF